MFRLTTHFDVARYAAAFSVFAFALDIGIHLLLDAAPFETHDGLWRHALLLVLFLAFPTQLVIGLRLMKSNQRVDELEMRSSRDRLTQAATRDHFFETLETGPERPGVSLLVDIDHFKKVNDTYGHLVGDQVLAEVAARAMTAVRKSDILCRFGGEEFVIFLQETDQEEGAEIAERVRSSVAEAGIAVDHFAPISVTVSIGGAMKSVEEDITSALYKADVALYRAKDRGRNRIEWSTCAKMCSPDCQLRGIC